jgi:hypothetical protein
VVDPGVEEATFGSGGIVERYRPQEAFFHDLLDGMSVNPHERKNPFAAIAARANGLDEVHAEVCRAAAYVGERFPMGCGTKPHVVSSNHDDFLRRWIFDTDWRQDPTNAIMYLETALEMARATVQGAGGVEYPSPFTLWMNKLAPHVNMLRASDSHKVLDIEMALHGHHGPNGSRGSVRNLRRIGTKIIMGHTHSPAISEGAFCSGTSSLLRLGYNVGPTGWAHAHTLVYATGKRTLLFIVGNRYRASA